MKTFLARSAALALACILTTAALWFAPGNYLHPLSMVINKRDILLSRRPPRVVLMGGSNLLTVRSAVIARETGLPVVNMGVWAGCPVHDVFDLIADDLAPGDVVVVVMEYPVLFVKEYGKDMEKDRFSFLLRPGLYSVKYLREGRPLDILRLYFGILQIKVKTYILHIYKGEWRFMADRGSYKYRGTSNEYGDRIVAPPVMRPLGGSGDVFRTDGRVSRKHLEAVRARCEERGIRMAYCFAPYPRSEYARNRERIDAVYEAMRNRGRIPLLNAPEDNIYDDRLFADTVNHLAAEGEEIRTKKLAGQVKKFLDGPR